MHSMASCGLHIFGLKHIKVGNQSTSRRSSEVISWISSLNHKCIRKAVSSDHKYRNSAIGDNYAAALGVTPYNGHG